MVLITLGAVILFDVVATLRGGADTTLAVGATTLGDGGSSGASRCLVMMAVRFRIAWICLIFSIIVVGTVFPSALRMSAAATMERLCCEVTRSGSGLDAGATSRRTGSVAWMGCRIGGIGSGWRLGQHRNHWLRGVPRVHGMLGHHK